MRITVKFVGATRLVIGEQQRTVDLERGTVRELLDGIFKLHPEAKDRLKQAGVFVDGRMVKNAELREPILKDGQEVSLILPVAGG
ncbi:MAG: MoaD/ThiS family protein [Promethearchaeati archaeon SRVP18_Atabeyarchaeia-1]